jgi:hypothetical protein
VAARASAMASVVVCSAEKPAEVTTATDAVPLVKNP